VSNYRLGDEALCELCHKPIEWQGQFWRHTSYTPRHSAEPVDGTIHSPLAELEEQRDALLAACKAMSGLVTLGQRHASATHAEEIDRIEYEISKVFAQAKNAVAKAEGENDGTES